MRKLSTPLLGLGLAAGAALLARAADPPFDVKPGLWEVRSVGATSGTPPIPEEALARMSPDQRAQFEEAVRAAIARSGQPHTSKMCVTQRQLEKGPDFAEHKENCRNSVTTRTATTMEVHVECTGAERMSGTFHVRALSREAVHGDIDMVIGSGSRMMTSKRAMDGKWLGSDCGGVKPSGEN